MSSFSQVQKLPSAAYDNKIYAKFSSKTIEKKAVNKEEFQKEFGLIPEKKTLLVGFPLPLTEKNGASLLEAILPGIEAIGVQLAVMGIGTEKYQQLLNDFANEHHNQIVILENNDDNLRKLYSASDVMLFLKNNEDNLVSVENALMYGIVPISEESYFPKQLKDYNPNQETGNAFLYVSENEWQIFGAIVRAIENFKFPYDWKNIAREGLEGI